MTEENLTPTPRYVGGRRRGKRRGNLPPDAPPFHLGPFRMPWTKERLLAMVEPEPMSGCWLWTGHTDHGGYGRINWWLASGKKTVRSAHRVAYAMLVGPIPEGLTLDHLCRVPCCVNPAHLEPVTMRVNVMRGTGVGPRNAKKTHCHLGHEYTPENTRRPRRGGRRCRTCDIRNDKQKYLRHKTKMLAWSKRYYVANRERVIARVAARKARLKEANRWPT